MDKNDEAKDIQEKMKKVDVKSSSAPTVPRAYNTVLLPSAVTRVKQQAGATNQTGLSSSGSATGNPRNKTALAPGHSLMDWIRLGNSGVDLTGVGGVPRVVTLSELASHNKQNDAWIAIRGIVFNVTRYMDFHPGGISELMRGVGKDATKLFESVHAWVNYQSILQKCVVGRLSRGSVSGTASSPTENPVASTTNCSSTNLISCTAQNISQENVSDNGLSDIKMDCRQTSTTVTMYYQPVRDYAGVCYELSRLDDEMLLFKIIYEKDILTHTLEVAAEIYWPPVCTRRLDTLQVEYTFTKRDIATWDSLGSQRISREPNRNFRTYREYHVVVNKELTKLVHLLVLRAQDFLQVVPLGRYVEVKMNVMGMEVSRWYTPVPPCLHPDDMVPNYTTDCLCLMIKKYPSGVLSPFITSLETGQTLLVSNALGAFVAELYSTYNVIHMLAGGTGLTVMLGIIQWALARPVVTLINLINFNKNEDNMFYVAELEKVAAEETKLEVRHVLSEADKTWMGIRGMICDELLKEWVGQGKRDACVFTCGPREFVQSAKTSLQKLHWMPYQMYEFDD